VQTETPDGTVALTLLLDNGTGWKRDVPLRRAVPFSGTAATVSATLALDRLVRLFGQLTATTGVRGAHETIGIRADVAGRSGGPFRSEALFALDPARLQLVPPGSLAHVDAPALRKPTAARPHLAVTRPAAAAGGASAILAVLAGAAAVALRRSRHRQDPVEQVRRRHRSRIVELNHSMRLEGAVATVTVASLEELVRLGASYDRLILHEQDEREEAFGFTEDGVNYVFRRPSPEPV
jgi:hypothetical protein